MAVHTSINSKCNEFSGGWWLYTQVSTQNVMNSVSNERKKWIQCPMKESSWLWNNMSGFSMTKTIINEGKHLPCEQYWPCFSNHSQQQPTIYSMWRKQSHGSVILSKKLLWVRAFLSHLRSFPSLVRSWLGNFDGVSARGVFQQPGPTKVNSHSTNGCSDQND